MVANNSLTLMDAGRIERSLKRIAYQIAESNRENNPVVLLGINEKGALVAGKLSEYLSAIYSEKVKSIPLLLASDEKKSRKLKEEELENKFLVLVDDVIFSGRTMFKALGFLSEHLKLEEIHTVVLVDRGHRKLPIDAQFVGLNLPTKLNEHVSMVTKRGTITEVRLSSR